MPFGALVRCALPCCLNFRLASSYGVPHKLVIEEAPRPCVRSSLGRAWELRRQVTAGILKSLKEMLRQIIGPLQASESDRQVEASELEEGDSLPNFLNLARSKKAPGEGLGLHGVFHFCIGIDLP